MVTNKAASFVVKRFSHEHYTAIFNPNSGFFARIEDAGHDEPFWAEHGPELLDIAITNWCDRGCSFCYRKSDESGSHMSVDAFRDEHLNSLFRQHIRPDARIVVLDPGEVNPPFDRARFKPVRRPFDEDGVRQALEHLQLGLEPA
jgi:hypothetical protein